MQRTFHLILQTEVLFAYHGMPKAAALLLQQHAEFNVHQPTKWGTHF